MAALCYDTEQLDEDLEVTGPIAVVLHADIDQTDTNWIVRLRQIDQAGRELVLTQGFLNASHRAVEPARSVPGSPHHPHTAESIAPVEPGRIHEYAIAMVPACHVFAAGSRIRLEICARDFNAPYGGEGFQYRFQHLPASVPTTHRIHHTAVLASHLELPLVPPDGIDREYHEADPQA
ncbi:MAG: CocE/NonD family hydrolase [Pseudonocardiaceae bacterium]|nr:CocE/NonD family hydrolase [Pseudonocardiaceae bacterium]